ncbi:hypothetical protein ICN32_00765 [Polynucleobacter wuianus]|uniref:hypothetical protein n=1 Tax=Polynucleobacter wuianus TaxID=1743168 RepID=UPI001C0D0659|nr:hypothetical protein [Polynucleobacter wuianus]MBU3609089.1 hypothetical protein [Polynucleobacter wuianus]
MINFLLATILMLIISTSIFFCIFIIAIRFRLIDAEDNVIDFVDSLCSFNFSNKENNNSYGIFISNGNEVIFTKASHIVMPALLTLGATTFTFNFGANKEVPNIYSSSSPNSNAINNSLPQPFHQFPLFARPL